MTYRIAEHIVWQEIKLAIGQFVVDYGHLDATIRIAIARLITDAKAAQVLAFSAADKDLEKLFLTLMQQRFPSINREPFKALLKEFKRLREQKRNNVVHSIWLPTSEGSARVKYSLTATTDAAARHHVTEEELRRDAQDCRNCRESFRALPEMHQNERISARLLARQSGDWMCSEARGVPS